MSQHLGTIMKEDLMIENKTATTAPVAIYIINATPGTETQVTTATGVTEVTVTTLAASEEATEKPLKLKLNRLTSWFKHTIMGYLTEYGFGIFVQFLVSFIFPLFSMGVFDF